MTRRTRSRRVVRCRAGLLCVVAVAAAARADERAVPAMPAFLSGIVTEADGITPSARVIVMAQRSGAPAGVRIYFGNTDANGAFVTTAPLTPGDYDVGTFGGTNQSVLQTITIAADGGPVGVRLARPSGSIAGIVTDPAGNPAAGARVTLLDPTHKGAYNTEADASGAYQIDHVLPGTYDVLASRLPNGPGGPLETVTLPKQNIGTAGVTQNVRLASLQRGNKPAAPVAPPPPRPVPATRP